jgi:hypothetical protein
MGTLTGNGGAPATPLADDGPPITNDGFWPDIDLGWLRGSTRLTGNITASRLRTAAVAAVLFINPQLAAFRATKIAQGWDSAADMDDTIDGKSVLVQRYLRAVACSVQADLAEHYRDWDTTRAGDYRGESESAAADEFRRNAQWALADILGRTRNVVELI